MGKVVGFSHWGDCFLVIRCYGGVNMLSLGKGTIKRCDPVVGVALLEECLSLRVEGL